MSAPAWLAAMGLVTLTPAEPDPDAAPPPAPFSGAFDAPPAELWVVPLPGPPVPSAVHTELGGPVLHGDHIFVGTAGENALLVLDRSSGRLLRRLPARAPVESTPVVAGDTLYYADGAGTTWSWPVSAATDPDAIPNWTHIGSAPILSTPLVTPERIVVSTTANVVYALDPKTGELSWRHNQKLDPRRANELELYGSPTPTLVGDLLVTGFSDGTLVGLSAAAGELVWQRRVGEGQYPDIMGSARPHGGDLVVAGYTEPLVSVDIETRNIRWRVDVGGAQAAVVGGGAGEAPVAFTDEDPAGGFVFHGGVDGILRCLEADSGHEVWKWDSETSTALTRPVPTPAGLLVGASGGGLYLVDPSDGSEAWRWQPGHHLSGVTVPPAVEGRQAVVVTNAGHVASFVVPVDDTDKLFGAGAVGWYDTRE
jgi:outer membrane protein assembly factor BamB